MATICKRKDGTWCAAVVYGVKDDGKPNRKYLYGKTKKEVEEKLRKFTTDIHTHGSSLDDSKITLAEWTYKHLFTNMKNVLSPSTFDHYVERYEKHIKNSPVGYVDIKQIRQIHLQEYFNSKDDLSYASQKKLYNILNSTFKGAINNNLIRVNPITSVKLKKDTAKKEIKMFSKADQKAYMEAAAKDPYGLLFLTMLFTGMRLGEVTALRWKYVDFETGLIAVMETVKRVTLYDNNGDSTKDYVVKPPKSSSGYRTIQIPQFLSKELRKYKLASKYSDNEHTVFCTSTGNFIGHENARRTHYRLCDNANIERIPVHALRHTFATRLIEQGENFKTVQELLGHSDIQTTMNIYVHVLEETKKAAITAQDRLYDELTKVL